MNSPTRLRAFLPSIPILLGALACSAQAGTDYRGESIFGIQGSVVVRDGADTNLVPTLAFFSPGGLRIVDGVVAGQFPSKFSFDVTDPPPDDAVVPMQYGPGRTGSIALGSLVMLRPDHADTIPYLTGGGSTTYDSTGLIGTRIEEQCSAPGQCRRRTLECTTSECELLQASGDPAVKTQAAGSMSGLYPAGDYDFTLEAYYGQDGQYYREFRRCDLAGLGPTDSVWSGGTIETCRVLQETRDPLFVDYREIDTAAKGFIVLFAAQDYPDFPVGALERGYDLVVRVALRTAEQWVAHETCAEDAAVAAVARFNLAHNTSYPVHGGALTDSEEAELDRLTAELASTCPSDGERWEVRDPLKSSVTLELGSLPENGIQ
jgi:hypothetical protein